MWADFEGMRLVEIGGQDQVYEAPWAHGPSPLGGQDPADRHTTDGGRPALTDLDAGEGPLLDRGVDGLDGSAHLRSRVEESTYFF